MKSFQKITMNSGGVRFLLTLLAGLAWGNTALAQGAASAATSAQAACLVKPTTPLKYPELEVDSRVGGVLKAKLTFTRPDRAPKVEILAWSGTVALADAAEIYLLGYRLPCLGQGERVVLEQEVVFTALGADEEPRQTASSLGCMRTPGPFSYDETMQTSTLIKQKEWGNVLLGISFYAPDQPPKIKELYNSAPDRFRMAVLEHVQQYRLPCMLPGAPAVTWQQQYIFQGMASQSRLVLRDMGLVTFLGAAKDVDKVPLKFDLGTMACPFQARFTLYQPAASNNVTAIGKYVPEREPFLAWLSTLALNIEKKQFEALLGAEMVIDVPCGTIQL